MMNVVMVIKCVQAEQKRSVADKEAEIAKHKLESSSIDIKNVKSNLNEIKNKVVQQEAELDECYNRLAVSEMVKKVVHLLMFCLTLYLAL